MNLKELGPLDGAINSALSAIGNWVDAESVVKGAGFSTIGVEQNAGTGASYVTPARQKLIVQLCLHCTCPKGRLQELQGPLFSAQLPKSSRNRLAGPRGLGSELCLLENAVATVRSHAF
jgi:hypothetical protein